MPRLKLFIVVNVDWFFLSHRLYIALAAKKMGYDVSILCADTGKSDIIVNHGLTFIEVPFKRSGTNILHEFKCIRILNKLYNLHKPDIVHHVTIKVALYGSLAARLSPMSHVVNAISGLGYNFTAGRKGKMQILLFSLMKLGFKRKGTHFIFQNTDDLEVFIQLKILHRSQTTIIKGSGVDLNEYYQAPFPSNGKINVLLSARLLYDKGVIEFIEAARKLEPEFYDKVQFTICGNFDIENLANIPESHFVSLIDNVFVKWIGFQSDMVATLANAHIIVLPSYREGLPKSLIEAAAIGRPIVSTDVPGCRECVIDGYNGFLVAPKDADSLAFAIRKLLVDVELRTEMGNNSRLLAEQEFSIQNVIQKTLDVYLSYQKII